MLSISLVSSAQRTSDRSSSTSTIAASNEVKMNAIKGCNDLNTQLISLFGEKFSLNDAKVISQLKNNIEDKTASDCIRKNSLFAIYGNEYKNHLDKISSSNSPNSTK